jgi:hypothetical protein
MRIVTSGALALDEWFVALVGSHVVGQVGVALDAHRLPLLKLAYEMLFIRRVRVVTHRASPLGQGVVRLALVLYLVGHAFVTIQAKARQAFFEYQLLRESMSVVTGFAPLL